jgi:hypothetical protein
MQNIPFLQDCFKRNKPEFNEKKIESEILFERTKEEKKPTKTKDIFND